MSEEITGRALRDFAQRDEVVVATKVHGVMGPGPNDHGLSRKHILSSIDASLKRLGMDYVDLYQIHRWDYETPIEETLEALHDVVRMGKARYIGASSMYAWQFAKALYTSDLHGWTRFVSMQPHYNLIYREEEREMLPLCQDQKIGVIPWSPLARGLLTGKRVKGGGETERARSDGFAKSPLHARRRFCGRQPGQRSGQRARRAGCADCPGLDADQTGHHRPDHRGHQAGPPGRRRGGRGGQAFGGGSPAVGRDLPAAPGARVFLIVFLQIRCYQPSEGTWFGSLPVVERNIPPFDPKPFRSVRHPGSG